MGDCSSPQNGSIGSHHPANDAGDVKKKARPKTQSAFHPHARRTLSVQFRQLLKFIETGESRFTSLRAAADLCFLFDVRKS
jgi:hypothetical protein